MRKHSGSLLAAQESHVKLYVYSTVASKILWRVNTYSVVTGDVDQENLDELILILYRHIEITREHVNSLGFSFYQVKPKNDEIRKESGSFVPLPLSKD